MARRHWLDPLARQLLVATGQIPPATSASRREPPGPQAHGMPDSGTADSGMAGPGLDDRGQEAIARQEQIEQELLALKLRQDPGLKLETAAEVRRAAALGWRLDVNRATASDWRRLPGIEATQVDLLLRLQAAGIQLSGPEDLHQALEWPPERIAPWLPVLRFRWYGEPPQPQAPPPVDINRVGTAGLEALGLTPEQCQRLRRERSASPFRDLADLQQRLQLPPSLLERWIGKVRFSTGPCGPVLPPAPGRRG